ncbi:hypothetical protein CASFOL_034326 [Castilleja foliolosa]|uniref:Uncharacterized protein n=1 Tax=Castilleja foliolosa TaxID=1961234 RepID=A0ABD3BWF2_9LAMI
MKNAKHFNVEAVPGLANIITSKRKHKYVQPRLLKRLFKKKPLADYLNFFDQPLVQNSQSRTSFSANLEQLSWRSRWTMF